MGSVGTFGTERPQPVEELTFGYFGKEYRVHPDATDLALVEFLDLAATIEVASSSGDSATVTPEEVGEGARQVKAIVDALRELIHPDDYPLVWASAKKHRQTIEDLTELAMGLASAAADRPTERPSDSSDGPQTTEPSSTGDSSWQDKRQSVAHRFEEQGRPDLAIVALDAPERAAV